MDSLSQIFERQYLWNEAINHDAVLSPNNVIHIGESDAPIWNFANSPFKYKIRLFDFLPGF